jgi:hypothetical protein
MIRSKSFPILGGMIVVAGTMAAVEAFGQEKAVPKLPYLGKEAVELPTKRMLAAATAPATVNPKVQPGLVGWHPDFAAACEAAKKSKKPVLLFQMMGKLDDQFC